MEHIEPILLEVWTFDKDFFPETLKATIEAHLINCSTCRLFVNRMANENDQAKLIIARRAIRRRYGFGAE